MKLINGLHELLGIVYKIYLYGHFLEKRLNFHLIRKGLVTK